MASNASNNGNGDNAANNDDENSGATALENQTNADAVEMFTVVEEITRDVSGVTSCIYDVISGAGDDAKTVFSTVSRPLAFAFIEGRRSAKSGATTKAAKSRTVNVDDVDNGNGDGNGGGKKPSAPPKPPTPPVRKRTLL